MSPHISIKGELLFEFFGFPVTNTIVTTIFIVTLFVFIARYYYAQINKKNRSLVFYGINSFILVIRGLLQSVLGKKTDIFFPLLGSFFFFILLMNWSGLLPGVGSLMVKIPHEEKVEDQLVLTEEQQVDPIVEEDVMMLDGSVEDHSEEAALGDDHKEDSTMAGTVQEHAEEDAAHADDKAHAYHKVPILRGGTADLNTTLALALISVFATQMYGLRFLGLSDHVKKYFNLRDPMTFFLGPLEVIQEFARIISFGFRLYGNIFAGEVLLTIIPFLVPIFFAWVVTPIFFLEIFVGVVQALVFVMLSAVFINMATSKHH